MQQNYVKIPKDLSLIKQKFMFGLTKRQVICFGIGLALGLAAFFLIKSLINDLTISIFVMGVVAAPAIFCGLYNKDGIYAEQQIKLVIRFFRKPRIRIYKSLNTFKAIERQIEYNKLKQQLKNAGYSEFENKKKVKFFEK